MQFSDVRNEGLHHDKGSMRLLFRKEGEITFSRDGLDRADHRSRAILCSGLSLYLKTNLAEAGCCFWIRWIGRTLHKHILFLIWSGSFCRLVTGRLAGLVPGAGLPRREKMAKIRAWP
jgi:hypothetical protein